MRTLLLIVLCAIPSIASAKGSDAGCRETFDVRDGCVEALPPGPLELSLNTLTHFQTRRGAALASASGAAVLGITGIALIGMAVGTFALASSVPGEAALKQDFPDPRVRLVAARAPVVAMLVGGVLLGTLAVVAIGAGVLIGSGFDLAGAP